MKDAAKLRGAKIHTWFRLVNEAVTTKRAGKQLDLFPGPQPQQLLTQIALKFRAIHYPETASNPETD